MSAFFYISTKAKVKGGGACTVPVHMNPLSDLCKINHQPISHCPSMLPNAGVDACCWRVWLIEVAHVGYT